MLTASERKFAHYMFIYTSKATTQGSRFKTDPSPFEGIDALKTSQRLCEKKRRK